MQCKLKNRMMQSSSFMHSVILSVALVFMQSAQAQGTNNDAWEGFNRVVYRFNDTLDRIILKPVAIGYDKIMPDLGQTAVSNFFNNLSTPKTLVNNVLQGKIEHSLEDFARFTFNSTFGLVGMIDVATPLGIANNREDFGQTLGVWGVPSGPYVMLPFLGPSTVRDAVARFPDSFLEPRSYLSSSQDQNIMLGVSLVDTRTQFLGAERMITGDAYSFIRDGYLQRRDFLIHDGNPPQVFDESDF